MIYLLLFDTKSPISEPMFNYLLQFSPPEKQAHILRQRVKQNADTMAVGGALARHMIYQAFHIPLDQQVIAYGPHGKPSLRDFPNAHFNISHSGPYVACAVSDKPVGVDIEQIRPVELCAIQRVCTKEEQRAIFEYLPTGDEFTVVTDRHTLARFFEIWTGKEAEVKRTGVGIGSNESISVSLDPARLISKLTDDFVLSVCS